MLSVWLAGWLQHSAYPRATTLGTKDVGEVTQAMTARQKAEQAVVRAARRLYKLGPEHPAFWHHYWHAYTNAVERLNRIEERRKP